MLIMELRNDVVPEDRRRQTICCGVVLSQDKNFKNQFPQYFKIFFSLGLFTQYFLSCVNYFAVSVFSLIHVTPIRFFCFNRAALQDFLMFLLRNLSFPLPHTIFFHVFYVCNCLYTETFFIFLRNALEAEQTPYFRFRMSEETVSQEINGWFF